MRRFKQKYCAPSLRIIDCIVEDAICTYSDTYRLRYPGEDNLPAGRNGYYDDDRGRYGQSETQIWK